MKIAMKSECTFPFLPEESRPSLKFMPPLIPASAINYN